MASSAFSPFRYRDYRLYWSGNFVSNIGTWMETIALGAYVAETTGKAFWSGIIAAAGFVPSGLLSPIGGVVADKYPRKPVLIGATLFQTLGAGLLCILAFGDHLRPGIIAVVVFLSGTASAIAFPAYQSIVRDLVPPEEITAAIGLGSAQWNLGRVLGPALAGLVIAVGSIGWALAINTISFFAVVVSLILITIPPAVRNQAPDVWWKAMLRGFAFVRTEPGLWASTRTMLLNTFLAAPFIALVPAVAKKVLHGGKGTVAALTTCQGVGAVLGALTVSTLTKRFGPRATMVGIVSAIPFALVAYAYGATIGLLPAGVALAVLGGLYMMSLISFSTAAQTRAPAALRGRVLAVNTTILGLVYPVGALLQGAAGDRWGLAEITGLAGLIYGGTLLAVRLLRHGFSAPMAVAASVA
jgi:predicted MFS family arabinose efflux permease